MKDIKTIIFDLGGVYFTDGTKEAIDINRKDKKISSSINAISNNIYEYANINEMLSIIKTIINDYLKKTL